MASPIVYRGALSGVRLRPARVSSRLLAVPVAVPALVLAAAACGVALPPSRTLAQGSAELGAQQRRARAVELTRRAASAFERGRYAEAVALCQRAVREDASYVRAYTWLGASQQKLGRLSAARSAFQRVVALSPSSPDAARARRGLREISRRGPGLGSGGWRLAWSVRAHPGGVRALAWRGDGAVLASGGADRSVRWWSRSQGRALGQWGAYREDVTSLAWSPRGDLLASGSFDNQLHILGVAPGTQRAVPRMSVRLHHSIVGIPSDVNALAWSSDGGLLAAGGADGTVRLWAAPSWSLFRVLQGHSAAVAQVAFATSSTLVSSGLDAQVRGWDVRSGRSRWQASSESPASMGASRDGRTVGVAVGPLLQWRSAASGALLRSAKLAGASLSQVAFAPNGGLVATGAYTPTLRLWSSRGALVAQVNTGSPISRAVAWSPDGRLIATGGADGWLRVWQAL